jgi:hypothetical protein
MNIHKRLFFRRRRRHHENRCALFV